LLRAGLIGDEGSCFCGWLYLAVSWFSMPDRIANTAAISTGCFVSTKGIKRKEATHIVPLHHSGGKSMSREEAAVRLAVSVFPDHMPLSLTVRPRQANTAALCA